jgi:hypothetical protein
MTLLITSMKVGTTTATSSCRARGDYDPLPGSARRTGFALSLPPDNLAQRRACRQREKSRKVTNELMLNVGV